MYLAVLALHVDHTLYPTLNTKGARVTAPGVGSQWELLPAFVNEVS